MGVGYNAGRLNSVIDEAFSGWPFQQGDGSSGTSAWIPERTFALPSTVDPERIEASYEDGLLTITVPKAVLLQRRQRARLQRVELDAGHREIVRPHTSKERVG